MDYKSLLSWIIGIIIGVIAIFRAGCELVKWSRRTRAARYAVKNATILAALDRLDKGQQVLDTKLQEMDAKRDDVRAGDRRMHDTLDRKLDIITSDLRVSVSATVTSLDGLIQLGRGLDKPVNGPVLKMRDRLADRITEGVGEEPMHQHGR